MTEGASPVEVGRSLMTRLVVYGTVVACVLVVFAAEAQQPIFRGSGDVVRVFSTVTDRDGRLATSLTQENFEVRDDGKPQPITQFDNSPQPIRLIVLLDCSGSMAGNLQLLRAASSQLFVRLRPSDLARVGSFGREVVISPTFTNELSKLRAALPEEIAPDAPTPLWRAIEMALDGFGDANETRRVILVLSDGKDTGPLSFRERPASQGEVIDRARAEDVMIYGVGMRSRPTQRTNPGIGPAGMQAALLGEMPDPGLARVAEETGGGYLEIRLGEDL